MSDGKPGMSEYSLHRIGGARFSVLAAASAALKRAPHPFRWDVLVAGAGPAGIAAAVRARQSGAGVAIIDDNPAVGGQIWRGGQTAQNGRQADRWLRRLDATIIGSASIVSGDGAARSLVVETLEGVREIGFHHLVIATGAREIFLPFPGWTLPGVTGVGGLQALVKSGVPIADMRVVVAGTGPLLLAAAAYLRKRGAHISLIAEQATSSTLASFALRLAGTAPGKLVQGAALGAALTGVPWRTNCWVEAAEGTGRLERVRVRCGRRTWVEECDIAAVSYGLVPNTELAAMFGCKIEPAGVAVDGLQQTSVTGIFCAGECTGIGGVDLSIVEGEIAGFAAAGSLTQARQRFRARQRARRFAALLNAAFELRPELKRLSTPETIVCRCEDVRFGQLQPFSSFRAAKLHTRCGMGPCQGRVCGTATNVLFGWADSSPRPPIFPTSVGALAIESGAISEEAPVCDG